jgi:hypothetical protein
MYGFLLFLGAGLVLVGMILVLSNLRNVARRKRILATATSPISQAMGGPVEIKGNIVPSEKGLVEAPLSGRQAVWTRVTVEQYRSGSDGNPGGSSTVLNEVNGRPFFVDDNSGEVARVIPDGANVVLDQQSIGNSGQFHDPPPGFEEFLSMRGLSSKGFFVSIHGVSAYCLMDTGAYGVGAELRLDAGAFRSRAVCSWRSRSLVRRR